MTSAEQDADALRKAMKGLGTDEATIINIIANRTNAQRQKIKLAYKSAYGRDLIADLKSELHGNFEDATVALFDTPIEYDVNQLKKAMKGLGTDEDSLIEIIASRPNWMLKQIKEEYKKKYGKELEKDIISETSGDLKRLLVSLLQWRTQIQMTVTAKRKPKPFMTQGKDNGELMSLFSIRYSQWHPLRK